MGAVIGYQIQATQGVFRVYDLDGNEVGMYKDDPSYKGGMNWLPNLSISGNMITRKRRLSRSVVLRYFRQRRRIGR